MRRRAALAAAAVLLTAGATTSVQAQDDSAYSLSVGVDATSHFISYGVDVWGGGDDANPFSEDSTVFSYATLTLAVNDNLSAFVNVWGDINDNTESSIGGVVQEIDLNTGVTYTIDKLALTVAHGFWMYGGSTEHILDFTAAYNDADMIMEGFAINPSVTVHWRYEGVGAQDEGVAIVPGIKPSFTFGSDSAYPLTISVPATVAFFTDDFQGGDSGFGYASVGIGATIPLAFIPEKYGSWTFGGSATYFMTDEDAIPGNPEENFLVTALSIGLSI